jgi:hypothetical protein
VPNGPAIAVDVLMLARSSVLICLLLSLQAGCILHSTQTAITPEDIAKKVTSGGRGELRLTSATGQTTGWIERDRTMIVGDTICVRNRTRRWTNVESVRITGLTDATIALVLVDLPAAYEVTHLGDGKVELVTRGRNLTPWVKSAQHREPDESADLQPLNYYVKTWGRWRGPFSWSELKKAHSPKLGWPLLGTQAEFRKVDIASTIAVSVLSPSLRWPACRLFRPTRHLHHLVIQTVKFVVPMFHWR